MGTTVAGAARHVRAFIESMGIRCHPQCRISQMAIALSEDRLIQPSEKGFPVALEGFRDILILYFAITQLDGHVDSEILRDKFRSATKDHVHPQDDLKESPGRDVQSELYVATIARKAGLNPRLEEPDILCELHGMPLGVAVKRVKNEKQFEKRFRKAVKQIEGAGVRGVIAVDLSWPSIGRINRSTRRRLSSRCSRPTSRHAEPS